MEGAGGGVGGSEAYTAAANMNMMMKWDPRGQQWEQQQQGSGVGGLEELFSMYGIRYYTAARIAEMGFTARTLVNMTDHELDDMMTSLSHIFRWDLLVGERYGIKAAVRAHRTRLLQQLHNSSNINHHQLLSPAANNNNANFDALSHSHGQGVSEEAVQQEKVGSWMEAAGEQQQQGKKQRRSSKGGAHRRSGTEEGDQNEVEEEEEEDVVGGANNNNKMAMMMSSSSSLVMSERQREHPFIVTDPGEVPRGKKNGLDYLFSLYDQCREFLIQVQSIAKERGDKCPTKVTNEVFRYAKKAGASHINKPKMRHYVHCYALHCLDEEASDALRRAYKERGENVGAWRQACYGPLVAIAARQASSDIDSIFNSHPLLSIWYVPTKLRHLCHAHRHNNPTTSSDHGTATTATTPSTSAYHHHHHLSFC